MDIHYRKILLLLFGLALVFVGMVQAQSENLSKEDQINAAVAPAPEKMQSEATVLGYNEAGELVTLRERAVTSLFVSLIILSRIIFTLLVITRI